MISLTIGVSTGFFGLDSALSGFILGSLSPFFLVGQRVSPKKLKEGDKALIDLDKNGDPVILPNGKSNPSHEDDNKKLF